MSEPNDGGPAFPVLEQSLIGGGGVNAAEGMSTRVWLAGQALKGFCSLDGWGENAYEKRAIGALAQADAMLKALEEKP